MPARAPAVPGKRNHADSPRYNPPAALDAGGVGKVGWRTPLQVRRRGAMSGIEINKIVGAVLAALLLLLGIRFAVELATGPHGGAAPPVFVAAPAQGPEPEAERAAAAEAAPPLDLAGLIAAADPAEGARAFRSCGACHSTEADAKHRMGPNLWGVAGAPKAAREGFRYSAALAGLGGVWNDAALDAFLADPRGYAPSTKMAFAGIAEPERRAAVIAYLRTLADAPPGG